MQLNEKELIRLVNIVGQVSVPVASGQAGELRALINKMSGMIDNLKRPLEPKPKEDDKIKETARVKA